MGHCQYAQIGKFRPDFPGLQVFFLDRLPYRTNETSPGYRDSDVSNACLFTRAGELLWSDATNIWSAGSMRVDHWTGDPNEQFILLYSRDYGPPALYDGWGRVIATFPFPPALKAAGGGPEGVDLYEDYYAQHVSCWGDEREEILVFNHKALYIYTNAALNSKPRLYNNNYYTGRLQGRPPWRAQWSRQLGLRLRPIATAPAYGREERDLSHRDPTSHHPWR